MGEHIKEKEFTKYLGVLTDKILSWTYHINHVNLKTSRGKAILTKLRHYISKDTLHMLYFAFCPTKYWPWSNCLGKHNAKCYKTNTNIKKTRKMLFKKSNHPTEPLLQKLNILNFEKLKLFKIGIFMWKVLNDKVPQTLKDHFSIRERNYAMATIMQNSTCHWQTQTFSNKILFIKDQNFGMLYQLILKLK